MTGETFLDRQGFKGNPFASTNSEYEESLADYFVPPPYFESVLGSPVSPKSTIVFAPRGSGKTAQRRMIELSSQSADSAFVCLTYVDFSGIVPKNATLADHQRAVCRLLTVAALAHLERDPGLTSRLDGHQKEVLKHSANALLSTLNLHELETALAAVKSLGDKAGDLWRKYGGVVAVAINALMKKVGLDGVEVPAELSTEPQHAETALGYLFPQLVSILLALGYGAVYILVDKVDETSYTGNSPEAAFSLLRPLILDLPTLEQPGVAFKFFLWDQLQEAFSGEGGRTDRLLVSQLRWTVPELREMLSRRLAAFSGGRINNFNQLLDPEAMLDVHELLAHLSPDSPRDMIRMAERIVAEHTRQPGSGDSISEAVALKGIHEFAKLRSDELFGQYMKDLRRLPEPSFTMNRLANDVFKISTTAVRNKVVGWVEAGAVEKVGERSQGARPLHMYALKDPRLALATTTAANVLTVLSENIFLCPSCNRMLITANPLTPCPDCGAEPSEQNSRSLRNVCSRT